MADDTGNMYHEEEHHDPAGHCEGAVPFERAADRVAQPGLIRAVSKRTAACKRCGKAGLKWRWLSDGWRLYENERGEHNRLKEHRCFGNAADDFEAIE